MKIGIFGGSFNPIHYGHLILAEGARANFSLDKVIFMPAGLPPHKPRATLVKDKQRFKMIKLATEGNRAFDVSDFELKKSGMSYTYDTIKHFSSLFSGKKNELFFVMGIDLLMQIHTWKKSEGLLDLCTFLVGTRPQLRAGAIPEKIRKKVKIFKIPPFDVSSTYIRKSLREKKSIRYLVPDKVGEFICKNRLYLSK